MPFTIPDDELTFRAARAGGPGGQHVNKTSTKIEALWDVSQSESVSNTQRRRIMDKLSNRIDTSGRLRVAAGERRSQLQNRAAAVERMNELVSQALHVPKPRRKTKPPARARENRLAAKKKRSDLKVKREKVQEPE